MRWPWVGREAYETANRGWAASVAERALLAGRYDDLLAMYHALRLAGHSPPPVPDETVYEAGSVDDADAMAAIIGRTDHEG